MNKWITSLLLLQAACHFSAETMPLSTSLAGEYRLTHIENRPVVAPQETQVVLKDGQAHADLGCNQIFFAVHSGENQAVQLSDIGSTRMACPAQHIEQDFVRLLAQVNRHQWQGNILLLQHNQQTLMQWQRLVR